MANETVIGNDWVGNPIGTPFGGTGLDLSETGGPYQLLQQLEPGGVLSVGRISAEYLDNGTLGEGEVVLASALDEVAGGDLEPGDELLHYNVHIGDDYERAFFRWSSNVWTLGTEHSGAGMEARGLRLAPEGPLTLSTAGVDAATIDTDQIVTFVNGLVTASIGPTSARRHTLPNVAADTIALLGATQTLAAKTLTTPTIASFVNATHNHADATGGGTLGDSALSVPYIKADGSRQLSADWDAGAHTITATFIGGLTGSATLLNGATFAAPGAIGGGTPGAGTFTSVTSPTLTIGSGNIVNIGGSELYVTAAGTLWLRSSGGSTATSWNMNAGHLVPGGVGTLDLGSTGNPARVTYSVKFNGLTLTSSTGTLTLADGKTFTISNTLTFTGTDSSSVAFGTGGTVVYTGVTTLSSLASIGTVTTGVWNATVIPGQYGGTGIANTGKTITLGDNLVTVGAFAITFTATATTGVTLPTTGTLATLAGSEAFTNKTYNGLTLTSTNGTFTLTNGKTLSVSNTLTFTGTDTSSVAFGGGGTVVYTTVTALSSLVSIGSVTTGTWSATAIAANKGGTGITTAAVGDIPYYDSTTPTMAKLAVGAAGTVLVGGSTPSYSASPTLTKITVGDNAGNIVADSAAQLHAAAANSAESRVVLDTFAAQSRFLGRRANGTGASKTAVTSGDFISAFGSYAYDGSAYAQVGSFVSAATQNHSGSQRGTKFELYVTLDGATSLSLAVGFQAGMVVGAPTGSYKGAGTLNAEGAYYSKGTIGVGTVGTGTAITLPLTAFTTAGGLVTVATGTSDERLKDWTPYTRGLDAIRGLAPIRYRWNEIAGAIGCDRTTDQFGFRAQNVIEHMPESKGEERWADGRKWLAFHGEAILGAAVNAINEIDARLTALEESCSRGLK